MNRDFFSSFEQRMKEFGARAGVGESVRVEVVVANGRVYVLDAIVEAADAWLQFDGHDPLEEEERVSLVLPYHQISHVVLTRQKVRMPQAGITR